MFTLSSLQKSLTGFASTTLLALCSCTAVLAQNGPHGSNGCNYTCQQTEAPYLATALNALVAKIDLGKSQSTRDLTNGALAGLATGAISQTTAIAYIDAAFQTLDGNGDVYKTTITHTGTNDPNSTEFALLGVASILSGNRLTQTQLSNSMPNILAALTTLGSHISAAGTKVVPSYSNIYLMNTVDRLLLGQALGRSADVTAARSQMMGYLNYIKLHGIHEFDSPTYSGTQMESLVEGYLWSTGTDQTNFKIALDYLWMDLAANFFPGNVRDVGPYSRDYDFRNGQGALGVWVEVMGGWTTGTATTGTKVLKADGSGVNLEESELYDSVSHSSGYQVPGAWWTLATFQNYNTSRREVFQTWGNPTLPTGNTSVPLKHLYITNNTTMGCTSGNYGPQDKMFVASLSGSTTDANANRSLGLISNVLDSTGSPYGTITYANAEDIDKAVHLRENMACSMSSNTALLTTYFNLYDRNSVDMGLSSNILFPHDVTNAHPANYPTLLVNGSALSGGQTFTSTGKNSDGDPTSGTVTFYPINPADVITLQGVNGGILGIRMMENTQAVDPSGYGQYRYQIEFDGPGTAANPDAKSNGVGRIVATHANSKHNGLSSDFMPVRVTWLVYMVDQNSPNPADVTGVDQILGGATLARTGSGSTRTWTASFPTYPADYYLTSIWVQRAEYSTDKNALLDVGTPGSNTGIPGYSGVLSTSTLDGNHTLTTLSDTFWANNPY